MASCQVCGHPNPDNGRFCSNCGIALRAARPAAEVLDPASAWPSRGAYLDKYRQLAGRFIDNFRKFAAEAPADVAAAGPSIHNAKGGG